MFVSEDRPSRLTTEFPVNRVATTQGAALCYGRFLQADPLGYDDGMNMYDYVGGDPVNSTDPSGLAECVGPPSNTICSGPAPGSGSRSNGSGGGSSVVGVVVGAANLVNKGLCSFGIKIFGGCKKKSKPTVTVEDVTIGDSIIGAATSLYCSLPSLGVTGSIRGYDILGGGVAFDSAFDPQSGRLGVSGGIDVGAGIGGEVKLSSGSSATAGRSVPNGWSGSVGANANVRLGALAGGVSTTLIGRNGPGFGGVSAGIRPGGTGATLNANLGARGGYGGQIVPGC